MVNKLHKVGLFFALLFITSQNSIAQELSRLRVKILTQISDTTQLDSLSLIEGSLIIRDVNTEAIVDKKYYVVNAVQSMIIWKQKPAADSLKVVYRTFPFSFAKAIFHKDISEIEQTEDFLLNPYAYIPEPDTRSIIDFGTLDYSGSFARGLSFGNRQDVILNSSFNLQLSGYVTKDIEVVAALTDNNIPVQPDGTTQQLQEFDKVFIQVKKDNHKLTVGDYEIPNPPGYFMKYFKKLQGGSYSGIFDLEEKGMINMSLGFAVTKGKYNRYTLPVTEGNQGPYKLIGANGETFIIVLAGTERVFINGRQLTRGAENDYIIDYNLGEITFMPTVLVTSDLRITVEFEYSERSYFRSLVFFNTDYEYKKVKLYARFYSEQDNKNQPSQEDLSPEQKEVLRNSGDNLQNAIFPSFQQAEYDANRVMYNRIDTVVNGIIDTIFVYSTNPDSALYTVVFTYVGLGKGDYVPAVTTLAGRVFEWKAPVNGTKQGTYAPYRVIIAPQRQLLATVGMILNPTKYDEVKIEGALSNQDLNTFSSLDKDNNLGFAGKAGYRRKTFLGNEAKGLYINSDINYELAYRHFRPIERYRSVEFNRDWNYRKQNLNSNEHLGNASVDLIKDDYGKVGYDFSTFVVGEEYTGYQHRITSVFDRKGYYMNTHFRYLKSESDLNRSKFIRPTVEVAKSFAKLRGWKVGARYHQEINKVRDIDSDSLLSASFVYNDWTVYIANADSARDKIRVEYIRRLEFFPHDNEMELSNISNTLNVSGRWITNKVHRLGWQFTYRKFDSPDSLVAAKQVQHFYLGRLDYGLTLFKGGITTNLLYELGSGKERKRQFDFLPTETGNYIHIDYNGNGIREFNEFEFWTLPSPPQDDTLYIKVEVPTNEFEDVNSTQFSQSVELNPGQVWRGKEGVKGFIARFSNTASLQISRKVFRSARVSPFNPFVFDVDNSSLVTLNSLIRNSFFYNRIDPVYGFEYTFQDVRRKISQINGIESTKLVEHYIRARWNIVRSTSAIIKVTKGVKANISENFLGRNYNIESIEVAPDFSYLFKTKFRITASYEFMLRENTLDTLGEKTINHQATVEFRYNVVSKSTLNIRFSFTAVQYTGAENSAIEFAMLEGLKDGNNYLWSASFDRYLGKNIQMSLIYDGRKTGSSDMVHIGRAQIRAIF